MERPLARPRKLRYRPENVKEEPSRRGGRIDGLVEDNQPDPEGRELARKRG